MNHNLDLGVAWITGEPSIQAGEYTTIDYTYEAQHPIDDSGGLKIVFRYASDAGTPQFDDPKADNYCSVSTDGDCRISPRWEPKAHTRPWDKTLIIQVSGGYLDKNQSIRVIFGDQSGGSKGWRMQTFCEDSFEFKTLVDPYATYSHKELPESPIIKITPNKAARTVIIAPSTVSAGEAFDYYVKSEDIWGNPVSPPKVITHKGYQREGIRWIKRGDVRSNPIRVAKTEPKLKGFWADFHGQSEETIGTNTIDDYYKFAREFARLDIAGHQGNDFQITDQFWSKIKKVSDQLNVSGEFVVFPGYEWSGNTPLGGDRNVYFLNKKGDIIRSSEELVPDSKYSVAPTANDLFDQLKQQPEAKPFCFAHVGGRYANLAQHDSELECAVEVHSAWGTFEWILWDAFERGYRVGICANSDGHKGRPGASYPGAGRFGSYGGLTCVLASKLTRQSVYKALQARHFYGTSGHRGILETKLMKDDKTCLGIMGDVVSGTKTSETSYFTCNYHGTAPIEKIDLFNGSELITTYRPYSQEDLGKRIKIVWSGAEVRGRSRMVDWTGNLTVSGNRILSVTPVQTWNPARSIVQESPTRMNWSSCTTGGTTGCILDLEHSQSGKVLLKTKQGNWKIDIKSTGLESKSKQFGGLEKMIEAYRLPDADTSMSASVDFATPNLRGGDNPLFCRATQVDGHVAWSSPIYLTSEK
tara:strand:- start:1293 stop:3386 length:2094 start_codon:yes stop_codon:yes gene_type:complete